VVERFRPLRVVFPPYLPLYFFSPLALQNRPQGGDYASLRTSALNACGDSRCRNASWRFAALPDVHHSPDLWPLLWLLLQLNFRWLVYSQKKHFKPKSLCFRYKTSLPMLLSVILHSIFGFTQPHLMAWNLSLWINHKQRSMNMRNKRELNFSKA